MFSSLAFPRLGTWAGSKPLGKPGRPPQTIIAVRATRTKWLRAEPIAALYEQGRVKHVGAFAALEDEMCDFGLDGLTLSNGATPAATATWGRIKALYR